MDSAITSGFIDSGYVYPLKDGLWTIVGMVIFIGTVASIIPQIQILISKRSNFGLDPLMVFMNCFCCILIVMNVVCLHSYQFIGTFQYGWYHAFPTLITFFNFFALWIGYMPVIVQSVIFFDRVVRKKRDESQIKSERKFVVCLIILIFFIFIVFFSIFLFLGMKKGFSSESVFSYGKTLGIICSVVNFGLFLPQIITTIKLEDHGSLSLMYLSIQGPGGMINTSFMVFGQHEHWTTWLPIFATGCQQILLLCICVYYIRKHKKTLINEESLLVKEDQVYK